MTTIERQQGTRQQCDDHGETAMAVAVFAGVPDLPVNSASGL